MNRSQQVEILSRIHAALEATRSVFERFTPGAIETEYKVGHDPVTEADRRAEETIRELIRTHYPLDGILGEEFGEVRGTSGYRWVLDPIDGTRAFIAGQPLWGTLIALEHRGKPVLGILDQPFLRERFVGVGGQTLFAHSGGTLKLRTRACASLGDAVICTTHPMLHFGEKEREQYFRVERACRLSRYGGDCYAYALIAMGFVDLVIETDLKRWDVAAILPIIEGAGGDIQVGDAPGGLTSTWAAFHVSKQLFDITAVNAITGATGSGSRMFEKP
jgi:myo-inositol-1(or 4)-monophosphatase